MSTNRSMSSSGYHEKAPVDVLLDKLWEETNNLINRNEDMECEMKHMFPHFRTDYDKENVGKRGVNQSGIPSPNIKSLPIIPLGNVPNYSKKNPTFYSGTSLKTKTIKIPKLKTHTKLQSQYTAAEDHAKRDFGISVGAAVTGIL